jgi:hypothetical protein
MKIKTSELEGVALDWAVAKCEGVSVRWSAAHEQLLVEGYPYLVWQPSKNGLQGDPIIYHGKISVVYRAGGYWLAYTPELKPHAEGTGSAPLIAAMRCHVASELGDEVEIPDELMRNL